mmetsp:Transcript_43577/g.51035  ORF Transcript_43577/g.51035 Transcript_43577/m.51035 type:complete len:86 (-) Transcript_43577:2-259(-)
MLVQKWLPKIFHLSYHQNGREKSLFCGEIKIELQKLILIQDCHDWNEMVVTPNSKQKIGMLLKCMVHSLILFKCHKQQIKRKNYN